MGISRFQFFHSLGAISIVDPITQAAYDQDEDKVWRENLGSNPHGIPWHTSFHASSFPGDDPKGCPRRALYELAEIPGDTPISRYVRQLGDSGKALEREIVGRWDKLGVLLSASAEASIQTGFEERDIWLTGNTDAILKPPGWNRGHVVDVKSKHNEVVQAMQRGERSYDPEHRKQILAYIGLANAVSKTLWPDLDPIVDGSLYYVSRGNPTVTKEYFFALDPNFMIQGTAKLLEWKELFESDILPARPSSWRWTESPCKYCKFKKNTCKPDYKDKIKYLRNSHGINYANDLRPGYSYEEKREAILKRWK